MKERIRHHKNDYEIKKLKLYNFINDNGGLDNWSFEVMIIIELDDDGVDRRVIEQQYIESENATLNKNKAFRDASGLKEYHKLRYIKNFDENREKQYRIENADKIKQWNKQWRIKNADMIHEKDKQYRLKNRDKEVERHKRYRIDNAAKIKERDRQRYYRLKQITF
jgi:hypothetical protein